MVLPAAKITTTFPSFRPSILPVPAPSRDIPTITTPPRTQCPRCHDRLYASYHEPECLQCGYADYSRSSSNGARDKSNLVGAGTRYVLRYVGQSPTLGDRLTHVQVVRLRNRAVYLVQCPFCSLPMAQSSLSGRRRETREERYKCQQEHRLSLTPGHNGMLGWK